MSRSAHYEETRIGSDNTICRSLVNMKIKDWKAKEHHELSSSLWTLKLLLISLKTIQTWRNTIGNIVENALKVSKWKVDLDLLIYVLFIYSISSHIHMTNQLSFYTNIQLTINCNYHDTIEKIVQRTYEFNSFLNEIHGEINLYSYRYNM